MAKIEVKEGNYDVWELKPDSYTKYASISEKTGETILMKESIQESDSGKYFFDGIVSTRVYLGKEKPGKIRSEKTYRYILVPLPLSEWPDHLKENYLKYHED